MSVVVCSDPLVEELRGVGCCVEQDGDGYCAEGYHCSWDFCYIFRERERKSGREGYQRGMTPIQ